MNKKKILIFLVMFVLSVGSYFTFKQLTKVSISADSMADLKGYVPLSTQNPDKKDSITGPIGRAHDH